MDDLRYDPGTLTAYVDGVRRFVARHTIYGFRWGPVTISRLYSDPKYGVWIGISTPRQEIAIRATPTGLLRVGTVNKPTPTTEAP